jgi:hypothetical protein
VTGYGLPTDPLLSLERSIEELQPGPWTNFESVIASLKPRAGGFEVPQVRSEPASGRAGVKGEYEVTAEIAANTTLFSVPASFRPKGNVAPIVLLFTNPNFVSNRLNVAPTGIVGINAPLVAGSVIFLDGITWNIT